MKAIIYLIFFSFLIQTEMFARVGGGGGDKPEGREEQGSDDYSGDGLVAEDENFKDRDNNNSESSGWGGLIFGLGFLLIMILFFLFLIKFPKVFPKLSEEALKLLDFFNRARSR